MQTLIEFVTFGFGQKTKPDHFVQRCCPKMATGDPLQRVDIAQATGAAFNIRFEIIAGTVIALVALVLFFDFRSEEFSEGQKPSLKMCFCSSRNSATSPIRRRVSIRLVATVRSDNPSSRHSSSVRTLWPTSSFTSQSRVNSSPIFCARSSGSFTA